MNNLATAYRDAGKLDRAIALHEQALKGRRHKLGRDHPDTLESMNTLARTHLVSKLPRTSDGRGKRTRTTSPRLMAFPEDRRTHPCPPTPRVCRPAMPRREAL